MQSIEHPYMLAFQSTPLMRGETLGTGWTFAEAI